MQTTLQATYHCEARNPSLCIHLSSLSSSVQLAHFCLLFCLLSPSSSCLSSPLLHRVITSQQSVAACSYSLIKLHSEKLFITLLTLTHSSCTNRASSNWQIFTGIVQNWSLIKWTSQMWSLDPKALARHAYVHTLRRHTFGCHYYIIGLGNMLKFSNRSLPANPLEIAIYIRAGVCQHVQCVVTTEIQHVNHVGVRRFILS